MHFFELLYANNPEVRAAVLRTHGVEVHVAEEIPAAQFPLRPHLYDLVLLDGRRYSPGEALEFYGEFKYASPRQQIVFPVRLPVYFSRTPGEVAVDDVSRGRWAETVKRYLAAS